MPMGWQSLFGNWKPVQTPGAPRDRQAPTSKHARGRVKSPRKRRS